MEPEGLIGSELLRPTFSTYNVIDMFHEHRTCWFPIVRILGPGLLLMMLAATAETAAAQDALNSPASGAATFAKSCAGCHGPEGVGGDHGPVLHSADFWSQWQGQPLRRLYSRIISTMPQDDPGSLSEQQVLGIVSYLTQLNTGSAPNPPVAAANDLNGMTAAPATGAASK